LSAGAGGISFWNGSEWKDLLEESDLQSKIEVQAKIEVDKLKSKRMLRPIKIG